MKKILQTAAVISAFSVASSVVFSADWDGVAIPADPGAGKAWQLNPLSDDFNYVSSAGNRPVEFSSRWKDSYINGWKGPSLTEWNPGHIWTDGSRLAVQAHHSSTSNNILTGCLTSLETVDYPLYMEAKVRMANATLANDVWLLSTDQTQEIDLLEAYPSDRPDQAWFDQQIHLSNHTFIRSPFTDYQPRDEEGVYGTWYAEDGRSTWRGEDFTIGVFWKSPWHLEYYINGKWVRTMTDTSYSYLQADGTVFEDTPGFNPIDKYGYTNGAGMNKGMHVIINMEQQSWRTDFGVIPTAEELDDANNQNIMWVDWIRLYDLVDDTNTGDDDDNDDDNDNGDNGDDTTPPGTTVVEMGSFTNTGKTGAAVTGDTIVGFNASGANNVNYNTLGDWADYAVNIANAGEYKVEIVAASPMANGLGASISFDGAAAGNITIANTGGWEAYQTFAMASTVQLSAGAHTMRVQSTGTSGWQWNGDEVRLTYIGEGSDSDNGDTGNNPGDDSDTTPGQAVKVEGESFVATGGARGAGFQTITWWGTTTFASDNQTGDWGEYNVSFPATGSYSLDMVLASGAASGANVAVYIDGSLAAESAVSGSSWNVFEKTRIANSINVSAGNHVVKVESTGPDFIWQWYLDSMTFTAN